MMNLTIGSTIVEITSCTRMRDTKRGFYLEIKIPKDNISMDALSALLDGNEQPITVTDGENVSVYNGFKMRSNLSLENGVYTVYQACTSEIEAQLSVAQNRVAEQEKALEITKQLLTAQAEVITAQGNKIIEQGVLIDEQSALIDEQSEQVLFLEEASTVQMTTIDSLLLDIIPAVVADAVRVAVADALESNSTTNVPETDLVAE